MADRNPVNGFTENDLVEINANKNRTLSRYKFSPSIVLEYPINCHAIGGAFMEGCSRRVGNAS